jgi:hypothetical protein
MKESHQSKRGRDEHGDEVWELLGRVRGVKASPTFKADVLRAVRAEESGRGSWMARVPGPWGWLVRPAVAVPAGLLAGVALFFVVGGSVWDGGLDGGRGELASGGASGNLVEEEGLEALAGAVPDEEKLIFLSDYEALLAVEDSGDLGDAEIAMLFGW